MSNEQEPDGPERDDRRFAQNMIIIREERGLSQADLVRVLQRQGWNSIYQTTISRIEKGDRQVRYGEARAIARALGVPVDRFLLTPAESRTAGRLAWARERLDDAHRRIREDTVAWWSAHEHLGKVIDETHAVGIEATELPDDEDVELVALTVADELALAMKAFNDRKPESAVRVGKIFYDFEIRKAIRDDSAT